MQCQEFTGNISFYICFLESKMDRKDQLFVINEVSLYVIVVLSTSSDFDFPKCIQLQLFVKHYQFYTMGRGGEGGGGEGVCVSKTTSAILSLCFMFLFVDL